MALTNDQITAQNFKDFYGQIRPYLNGAAHSGFTPIGTIIAVMGNAAPLNYLACDGQTVNIADYSELATYFNAQFGSVNFFGGDGTTTFGIPDLRGEFLRGTGNNGHANQGNGANVGTHQDATEHQFVQFQHTNTNKGLLYVVAPTIPSGQTSANTKMINPDAKGSLEVYGDASVLTNNELNQRDITGIGSTLYTSRPTNTSVLYCIATKNIFMDAGSNYSTEEQVVSTWIDGKPIYQKTIVDKTPVVTTDGTLATKRITISSNLGKVISYNIYHEWGGGNSGGLLNDCYTITGGEARYIRAFIDYSQNAIALATDRDAFSNQDVYITIQYTKSTD